MQTTPVVHKPDIERRLRALRRANVRMIEAELYNYRWSRQTLAQALQELTLVADSTVMSAPPDQIRVDTGRYDLDIVADRAEELMQTRAYTIAVLQETARRLDAIEHMLRRMKAADAKRAEAIEKVYFDGVPEEQVCEQLLISPRTLRRWKRDAVEMVAGRLGILV